MQSATKNLIHSFHAGFRLITPRKPAKIIYLEAFANTRESTQRYFIIVFETTARAMHFE